MYFRNGITMVFVCVLSACANIGSIKDPTLEFDKYIVRAGDTVESIAFRYQLDPGELRKINRLSNNGSGLKPGLRLQLVEYAVQKPQKKVRDVSNSDVSPVKVASRKLEPTKAVVVPASLIKDTDEEILESVEVPKKNYSFTNKIQAVTRNNQWVWPAKGPVARGYKPREINRQGLDIRGRAGDEIVAAADGTVVYSGQDLASHGKLVILRHANNVLSAYSSTDELFVQEDELVKAGDSIASLGHGNSNGSMLHFEIRKNGKPVNPLEYLPQR